MGAKKLLIVDDDLVLTDGLKRLAENAGALVSVAQTGKQALGQIKSEEEGFTHIIVDCVLPEDNGIALSKELQKANEVKRQDHRLFLTSGIIDPTLLGESIGHAESFLSKPIDRETLVKIFDNSSQDHNIKDLFKKAPDLELLLSVYDKKTFNDGYDLLPLIFGLSWLDFNGQVVLKFDGGEMALDYCEQLTRVTGSETSSSLGEVLVLLGFLNKNDLEKHLASEDFKTSKMRIGQHLIHKNMISPHSIDMAIEYQLNQRLISLLNKKKIKVEISQAEINKQNSKGKSVYYIFSNILNHFQNIEKIPDSQSRAYLSQEKIKIYETDKTFILDNNNKKFNLYTDEKKYQYLILSSFAGSLIGYKNSALKITNSELNDLEEKLSLNDPFKVFDVNLSEATDKSIAKKYHSVAIKYHPDKVASLGLEKDLEDRALAIFSQLTTEFNKIKTVEKRNSYRLQQETLEKKLAEQIRNLRTNLLNQLLKSEFKKAKSTLNKINSINSDREDDLLKLLKFWCDFKNNDPFDLDSVKPILESVSEDRQLNELKTYVKSIVELVHGNLEGSAKQLKTCLNLNPNFLPARRDMIELKSLNISKKQKKTTLSSLFSFKKSS